MIPLLVALPRLHRELTLAAPMLPAGVLTLWPGLPLPPEDTFAPEYPWNPAVAAACVADFEQAAAVGASGSPVQAFSLEGMKGPDNGYSEAEHQALTDWKRAEQSGFFGQTPSWQERQDGPKSPSAPRDQAGRVEAQRVLLLAWLQEKQVLELQALEERVRIGRGSLTDWLGDGPANWPDSLTMPGVAGVAGNIPDAPLPGGLSLPAWGSVLAAAAPFLPHHAHIVVTDQSMADAIRAAAGKPGVKPDDAACGGEIPAGWTAMALPLNRVPGLHDFVEFSGSVHRVFLCSEIS